MLPNVTCCTFPASVMAERVDDLRKGGPENAESAPRFIQRY
jgi:hypothetical protein